MAAKFHKSKKNKGIVINILFSVEDEIVLPMKEIRFSYISAIAIVVSMCKYSGNIYEEL